jgi:hypothetical protein
LVRAIQSRCSCHELISVLCGAALALSNGDGSVLKWSAHDALTHAHGGLWPKVVLPMFLSPLIGLVVAAPLGLAATPSRPADAALMMPRIPDLCGATR